MILQGLLGFKPNYIIEIHFFAKVNGICNLHIHDIHVLRLNYLFHDASSVFFSINGKQFNHEKNALRPRFLNIPLKHLHISLKKS